MKYCFLLECLARFHHHCESPVWLVLTSPLVRHGGKLPHFLHLSQHIWGRKQEWHFLSPFDCFILCWVLSQLARLGGMCVGLIFIHYPLLHVIQVLLKGPNRKEQTWLYFVSIPLPLISVLCCLCLVWNTWFCPFSRLCLPGLTFKGIKLFIHIGEKVVA